MDLNAGKPLGSGKRKGQNDAPELQVNASRPHVRKRKQDPQPRSRDDGIFIVPTSAENRAQIEGDGQHLSVHQASANPTPTSIAASPQSAPHSSFLGRSGYITSNDLAIDEDDAMRYEPPPPRTEGTLAELQSSMLQSIFAICLPPSSVRLSLIKSFLDRGRLWMPIVDPDDLGRLASETPGSLLLTAVFVAGSKLSAAPNALEWGEKCYFHAKSLLFWGSGHDTLQSITGSILLHWWNPSGPEHVSLDSSTLWLRISVGLALQAGLHREPDPGQPDGCLRRRLWWTLVVSAIFPVVIFQGLIAIFRQGTIRFPPAMDVLEPSGRRIPT